MKKLLREPLLHFALLGALLFVVHGITNRTPRGGEHEIVVSAGQIEHLAATFGMMWRREPTPEELQGLVDDYVREEVLNREAMQLGLHIDDTVIRRRLKQKMEFIAEDFLAASEPTDADLETYLRDNKMAYREPARVTFEQVYLSVDSGEGIAAGRAAATLELLRTQDAVLAEVGDRTLLPGELVDVSLPEVAAQFGDGFAADLDATPPGDWRGPIESAYGLHLVRVSDRMEPRDPALDEVRDAVRRDWLSAQREEAERRFVDALLSKYDVTVEWPGDPDAKTRAVTE